jgi:uncharacterized membrane protein
LSRNIHVKSLIVGSMLGCLVATQLWASEPVAPVAPPAEVDWSLIATKAVTFEVMSSALETGIFMAFYGGSTALAGSLFLVSLTTAGVAYAAHEYAWESALPADADRADPDLIASKSVTYRVLSTARSFMLGRFLGGGEVATSAVYALVVAVTDTALYAATELAFARWRGEGQASPAPVP